MKYSFHIKCLLTIAIYCIYWKGIELDITSWSGKARPNAQAQGSDLKPISGFVLTAEILQSNQIVERLISIIKKPNIWYVSAIMARLDFRYGKM